MRTNAIPAMLAAETTIVRVMTGRMPQWPIHRDVRGPASACPKLVAARTRPAKPYELKICSMWSRYAREIIPEGSLAVSWAEIILATPGVFNRSAYLFTTPKPTPESRRRWSLKQWALAVQNLSPSLWKKGQSCPQVWRTRPQDMGYAICQKCHI